MDLKNEKREKKEWEGGDFQQKLKIKIYEKIVDENFLNLRIFKPTDSRNSTNYK